MLRTRVIAILVSLAACALPHFEPDPGAVAPRFDRWETIVPASPDLAYATALGVVVEEGYTVSLASRADRLATTNLRLRYAGAGLNATSYSVRFTLLVRSEGPDSARITISGEQCFGDDLATCVAITARDGGDAGAWQFVRRLGEATLLRLAAGSPERQRPPRLVSGVAASGESGEVERSRGPPLTTVHPFRTPSRGRRADLLHALRPVGSPD